MREDEYGSAIERTLRQSKEPMTASELREAVGCSRQRVYVWLQANEGKLVQAGKDRRGAAAYAWAGESVMRKQVEYTNTLEVQSFFVEDGRVVLVVVGPDGSTYHARPAQ
jgi:hypothetical protein